MNKSVAFLELKYGNIYGGYPNFYAISEIAFLVFEYDTNKIFLESWINNAPVDIITVTSIDRVVPWASLKDIIPRISVQSAYPQLPA